MTSLGRSESFCSSPTTDHLQLMPELWAIHVIPVALADLVVDGIAEELADQRCKHISQNIRRRVGEKIADSYKNAAIANADRVSQSFVCIETDLTLRYRSLADLSKLFREEFLERFARMGPILFHQTSIL